MKPRLTLGIATVAALVMAMGPGDARALDMANFTSARNNCTVKTDPINTVWRGQWADWGTVDYLVVNRVGWPDSTGTPPYFLNGSTQWIRNAGGACTEMQTQRSLGFQNKHHVRLFQYGINPDGSAQHASDGNLYVFGDAHRDVKSYTGPCFGHFDRVPRRINGRSGFDQAALEIYRKQQSQGPPSPFYTWVKKIRTWQHRTFKQCDGSYVGGDGYQNIYHVSGQAG